MTAESRKPAKTSKVVLAVLGALTLAGVAAWIYQLVGGLAVTGMSNATSWGLYIATFMLFVGLSAGGLIVASSATVFGIKKYKAVAKPAVLLSTVCITAAAALVVIDMGGVQRIFNLFIHPHFTSPLMWDVCVISCYLIINLAYIYLMSAKGDHSRALRICSRVALPVAILVHSVTAWIFGLQIAKEAWHSAIMAPLFVSSALDSGLALLLIVLIALQKANWFKVDDSLIKSLAGLLCTCIAVDGFMVGSEVLTMAYPGAAGAETLAILTSGQTAPFFWFEVIGGVLVPFFVLLFSRMREKKGVIVACSALVVLGVFCKRVWLLLTAFVDPNIAGGPGITLGRSGLPGAEMWAMGGTYAPTPIEVIVVIGVISAVALAYIVFAKRFFGEDR